MDVQKSEAALEFLLKQAKHYQAQGETTYQPMCLVLGSLRERTQPGFIVEANKGGIVFEEVRGRRIVETWNSIDGFESLDSLVVAVKPHAAGVSSR